MGAIATRLEAITSIGWRPSLSLLDFDPGENMLEEHFDLTPERIKESSASVP